MTKNVEKSYTMCVPADLSFSSSIRRVSEEVFKYLGFKDPELFRFILVVDEIFMNAVQHGSAENSYVHMDFTYVKDEKIKVIVDDEGTGTGPTPDEVKEKMAFEFQRHDPQKTSGRGLAQIALNLADSLTFEKNTYGGIRVIFEKDINVSE